MKSLHESQGEGARPDQKNRHYLDPKNDPDVIWDDVRLTRYDKARAKLRDAEAKRDAILAMTERDADAVRRLLVVEKAIERHQGAVKRALTSHQQRLDEIDRYRAEEGNGEYNAKRRGQRRKVRQHENAKLSGMTPEQKAQHERDRRSDANWFKRQRDNGMAEAFITAAYAERLQKRDAERAMQNLPHYDLFGSAK